MITPTPDEKLLRANARLHFVRAVGKFLEAAEDVEHYWESMAAVDRIAPNESYPFPCAFEEVTAAIRNWHDRMFPMDKYFLKI